MIRRKIPQPMQAIRQRVFELVKKIPKGKVTSYGFIAKQLDVHPRAIGRVLHTNPEPIIVPCHRVVHADGSLANGYAFGGLEKQRQLLQNEGIVFDRTGKIEKQFFVTEL